MAKSKKTQRVIDIREQIATCAPEERVAVLLWILAKFDTAGQWNEGRSRSADEDFVEMIRFDSDASVRTTKTRSR